MTLEEIVVFVLYFVTPHLQQNNPVWSILWQTSLWWMMDIVCWRCCSAFSLFPLDRSAIVLFQSAFIVLSATRRSEMPLWVHPLVWKEWKPSLLIRRSSLGPHRVSWLIPPLAGDRWGEYILKLFKDRLILCLQRRVRTYGPLCVRAQCWYFGPCFFRETIIGVNSSGSTRAILYTRCRVSLIFFKSQQSILLRERQSYCGHN